MPRRLATIKLNELEAVVRKFKRAKATVDEEEYGRGLLLSLEWLLDELNMSPMEWFTLVDSRNGTQTGDEKLTYLELVRGIDMLCDELGSKMSRSIREKEREKREQAGIEMNVSLNSSQDIDTTHIAPLPAHSSGSSPKNNSFAPPLHSQSEDEQSVSSKVTTASHTLPATGKAVSVQVPHWRRNDIQALCATSIQMAMVTSRL